MKKLLLALAFLLIPSLAWAQCNGVFPANTLCGNSSGSPAPPGPFTATVIVGPGSSTSGDIAVWNNSSGSLLKDVPPLQIFGTQSANTFLGGPTSAGPSNPTFRALVLGDFQTQLNTITLPTVQSFTSGSNATYTTPAGALWIEVYMVGGGGGGGGANTGTTVIAGTGGNPSSFNSVTANGGNGGGVGGAGIGTGGAGGTGGTGSATRRTPGYPGGGGSVTAANGITGFGGSTQYTGGGGVGVVGTSVGTAGATNSGGGGSGGGNTNSPTAAGGGGGGEFVYLLIKNPAASYTYTVGTGGGGGSATDSGGAGAAGFIFVLEHYTP